MNNALSWWNFQAGKLVLISREFESSLPGETCTRGERLSRNVAAIHFHCAQLRQNVTPDYGCRTRRFEQLLWAQPSREHSPKSHFNLPYMSMRVAFSEIDTNDSVRTTSTKGILRNAVQVITRLKPADGL